MPTSSSSKSSSERRVTLDIDTLTEVCHNVLVAEMPEILRLPVSERLERGRQRRQDQLNRHSEFERRWQTSTTAHRPTSVKGSRTIGNGDDRGSGSSSKRPRRRKRPDGVHFIGSVALLEAVGRKDVEEVRHLLISNHCDVNACIINGLTALHQACIDGHLAIVKLLVVQGGANVNARDADQWTPLHTAALCGHAAVASLLIDRGADLLALNADGFMPYDLCEDERTLDVIESTMAKRGVSQEVINELRSAPERAMLTDLQKLARENADLNFRGQNGETPLHVAAANGYIEVAEYLLSRLVPIDPVDNDSWQPIHCAAYWRQVAMIELLVRHGADLDAATTDGRKLFDLCPDDTIRQWITEFKSMLEKRGVSGVGATSAAAAAATVDAVVQPYEQPTVYVPSPDAVSPANVRSNTRNDGSHTSLFNSNLSLADKSVMSSSHRRLAGHDKESDLHKKDARGECEIWTSMQSLAEVENEDEPTAKQSDDEPATKQIEPDDNRHLIIAPPAQFETANSSVAAAAATTVTTTSGQHQEDISASTVIRQTMTNALRSNALSDEERTDLILQHDLDSLQKENRSTVTTEPQPDVGATGPNETPNWEFKPKNATGDTPDQTQQKQRAKSSKKDKDKHASGSKKKRGADAAEDGGKIKDGDVDGGVTKPGKSSRTESSKKRGSSSAKEGADAEPTHRPLSAAVSEPGRGTSAELKKRRAEQRQQMKQLSEDGQLMRTTGLETKQDSANDEINRNIIIEKERRCVIL